MVKRDGKWVKEKTRPEPPPKKKKRLVTPDMQAASRANGKRSAGAKNLSAEDKERIALNATKHAHTCTKLIFLDDEPLDEFEAKVARFARQLGARTEPEVEQVRIAVYNEVKRKRIEKAEVCAVKQTVNGIVDTFQDTMQSGVRKLAADSIAQPGDTVDGLMQSTAGCSYLIGQFTILKEWLAVKPGFEVSMREHALRLGGHDPAHIFSDPIVMELNRAVLASISGPGSFTAAGAANAFCYDRPEDISEEEYERRMGRLVTDLPTVAEGRAFLRNYVETSINKLTERRALIELREARNLANAIGEARATTTLEGDRRQRYSATCTRLSNAAYRLMFTMQHERRKYGEGDLEGLERMDGPAATPTTETGSAEAADATQGTSAAVVEAPQTAAAPAGSSECRNEPETAQVVGVVDGRTTPSAPPARIATVPAECQDHPLAKLIAEGRKEFAQGRKYDQIE